LDEAHAFLERVPVAGELDSVLNLSRLELSLSALRRGLPPPVGDFEWKLRSSQFKRSTLLAEEPNLRKVLLQIDAALDDAEWEESDSSGKRLEVEMRALRRLLLRMDPEIPRLGPGFGNAGRVRSPTEGEAERGKALGKTPDPTGGTQT
jgi:hypothetical protein